VLGQALAGLSAPVALVLGLCQVALALSHSAVEPVAGGVQQFVHTSARHLQKGLEQAELAYQAMADSQRLLYRTAPPCHQPCQVGSPRLEPLFPRYEVQSWQAALAAQPLELQYLLPPLWLQ